MDIHYLNLFFVLRYIMLDGFPHQFTIWSYAFKTSQILAYRNSERNCKTYGREAIVHWENRMIFLMDDLTICW